MPSEARRRWPLAKLHDVHPDQITDRKNQLLERAAGVFSAEASREPKIDLMELIGGPAPHGRR